MRTVAAHPLPCRCPGASPSSPLGPLSIRFSRPCRVHTFPRGSQTPGPHAAELGERLVPWGLRPCPRASVPEGSLQEVPGRPSQRCPLPSFPVSLEEGARRTRHASRPGLCFLLQPPPLSSLFTLTARPSESQEKPFLAQQSLDLTNPKHFSFQTNAFVTQAHTYSRSQKPKNDFLFPEAKPPTQKQ